MLYISFMDVKYGHEIILRAGEVSFSPGISYIKGENGSGKTTFFNVIYKLIKDESLKISIDGLNIDIQNGNSIRNNYVSYCSQKNFLFDDLNVIDNITICNEMYSEQTINTLAEKINFLDVIKRNPKVKKMSGGEKQKLKLLIALSTGTPVVILDEPFNNLDSDTIKELSDYLFSENRYLLLTSHIDVDDVPTYMLEEGKFKEINTVNDGRKKLESINENLSFPQLSQANKKKLRKTNKRFRRALYLINILMVALSLFSILNTVSVYQEATVDKSNFVFSDTSTMINPPLYNSYFSTFGSEKWLESIPTYFSDSDIKKIEELDYVTKVIPTKNRSYSVGGISYKHIYKVDTATFGSDFTFSTSLYSKDVASNIPYSYFSTNDGFISDFIAGTFARDGSNEVIIDKNVADYYISELKLDSYDSLINRKIKVPVENIENGDKKSISFVVSGIFETELANDESSDVATGTIVTSFDTSNSYVQGVYAQYQDASFLLQQAQNRVVQAGISESVIKSQFIPNPSYDTLYIEVKNGEDVEKLTNELIEYNQYIEIENNYLNEQTVNFKYLSKLISYSLLATAILVIVYIFSLIGMMKLYRQSLSAMLFKLDFYAYTLKEQKSYLWFEIKEYILNTVVINLLITLFVQYFILNNFSLLLLIALNTVVFCINLLIINVFVRKTSKRERNDRNY